VPGWPESARAYDEVLPFLAARHHILAVDPPGLGDSVESTQGYDTGSISRQLEDAVRSFMPQPIHLVIRFTFFLFPSEDTESMSNLLDLFYFAGDRVDYVVVHNPAKVRTNLFKKSNIEAELKKFGAKELTLPVVTSITLLAIKRAEAKSARKLSFAEVGTPGASHLELMLAGEMQWAMQQMFRQYDAVADLLVPSEQMPEVEPETEPAAKPARSKQPMLNLGE
jgi:hypothetical protein